MSSPLLRRQSERELQLLQGDGTAVASEHALKLTRRSVAANPQALNAVLQTAQQNQTLRMKISTTDGCRPQSHAAAILPALCALQNRRPICALITLSFLKSEPDGGSVTNQTNDDLWLSFEALAKTYPHDDGVRMTADLARWLLEERERLQLPAPPIIDKVVRSVTQELNVPATRPSPEAPKTSG